MVTRCAIYSPSGFGTPENPFGKDVANLGLFRAIARHSGYSDINFLLHAQTPPEQVAQALLGRERTATRINTGGLLSVGRMRESGVLLRGKADLADLAWLRRGAGSDRDFSLVGLVHCIAPPALRRYIADAATAPVQPWDALICTSPVVRDNLARMFEGVSDHLSSRFGGSRPPSPPMPALPVIPLGVDVERFARAADRPDVREATRTRMQLGPDDVLVLWVGRLSFFEKAFPQPMFQAVAEAAARTGKRIHFAMAGWFPAGETGRQEYADAARLHAPGVTVHLLDGRKSETVDALWSASDIFLSLVDNVQETFGITPIEAMAAGLPVVVSDWDGYRANVVDGEQGFLVETLGGPAGLGATMLQRHVFGLDSYQNYVGNVAQHTAIDIGAAADAIGRLAGDPELRRRFGEAGRRHARERYDWPVIVRQIDGLFDELAALRQDAAAFEAGSALARQDPVRCEPFGDFAEFATNVLSGSTRLRARAGVTEASVARLATVGLNRFGGMWRPRAEATTALLRAVVEHPDRDVEAILAGFPNEPRQPLQAALMWMCKYGLLDWKTG
ncbi:Glycosyl transferases group 1 [Faunimonas pinastri]|uniref:Glycosyl transferases group 1 n=1 Tax=Faunimonas pinastri TaxID=1855383 RepID=A0A1H9F9K1_9HYPH|nr:glycosyltransferase family 4 protein [Faunimonas pinastri]SEQ34626.1 Glycosyl transferases group 1 [Faunimonas pinastri]